jgi:hypothetical protein
MLTAEWLQHLKPLLLIKYGCRAKSAFRPELNYLRTIALNLDQKIDEFLKFLHVLSLGFFQSSYIHQDNPDRHK